MSVIEALILGIVQGFTEFLPVSSTGHLAVAQHMMGLDGIGITFDVMLHLATLAAVVIVMWKEIVEIFRKHDWKIIGFLVIATIPAALAGLVFEEPLKKIANTLWILGLFFIVTGVILYISDSFSKNKVPGDLKNNKKRDFDNMSFKDTCFMGIAQAVGVIPGISRSGTTISGGLISGMSRESAVRFSFLMSIPIILGANIFSIKDMFTGAAPIDKSLAFPIAIGMAAAGVTGFLACKFMLDHIKKKGMKVFVYYMIAIGVITAVWGTFSK